MSIHFIWEDYSEGLFICSFEKGFSFIAIWRFTILLVWGIDTFSLLRRASIKTQYPEQPEDADTRQGVVMSLLLQEEDHHLKEVFNVWLVYGPIGILERMLRITSILEQTPLEQEDDLSRVRSKRYLSTTAAWLDRAKIAIEAEVYSK